MIEIPNFFLYLMIPPEKTDLSDLNRLPGHRTSFRDLF